MFVIDEEEEKLLGKGYIRVVRHITSNEARQYLDLSSKMAVIWFSNGPVGNGRCNEYAFYFRTPNDILEFGERIGSGECKPIEPIHGDLTEEEWLELKAMS